MVDTVTINSIDQTQATEGITIASVTVTVATVAYPQVFTICATDPLTVQAQITQQSEIARSQITAAGAGITNTTTLTSLVGTSINL